MNKLTTERENLTAIKERLADMTRDSAAPLFEEAQALEHSTTLALYHLNEAIEALARDA